MKFSRLPIIALATAFVLPAAADEPAPAAEPLTHELKSGRSYQVLLPAQVEKLRGQPVVLYLHPSGSERYGRVRRDYWPLFARRGCLLVMPESRKGYSWRAGDVPYVLEVLDDVRSRYEADPKRVVLFGISGGGQAALYMIAKHPKRFRAAVVVSTRPVVVKDEEMTWFRPPEETIKRCPYLVVNHITQGASLMYWRQARAEYGPDGASISILPVLGKVSHYARPPKELPAWLDAVLAGKHPDPLPDPQAAAVEKMFARTVAALPKALKATPGLRGAKQLTKRTEHYELSAPLPAGWERSKKEADTDAAGRPVAQIRVEHPRWPIYLRYEVQACQEGMKSVLAAEERTTRRRGLLYQRYRTDALEAGGRTWTLATGSITIPHQEKGWLSTLFVRAVSPLEGGDEPKSWLTVTLLEETQKPDATEMAAALKAALSGVKATIRKMPEPTTRPAEKE